MAAPGTGTVVVAGEALYDLVPLPSGDLGAHPGGGPFNTARTLGRLEQPVAYLGRLSTDRFGERLAEMLAEDVVALDAVVRTDDPTTLALAEVDAAGVARYRFYERGTSAPGLTLEDARRVLPVQVDVLLVGTLGLVLEPMAASLEAIVGDCDPATLVALDPNVRPSVIADEAAFRARLARVLARADLVKLSEEDIAWLDPERTPVDAARALLDAGPAAVVLTRGADGAVSFSAGAETEVAAPPVEVADTIGAGDAFGGGLLAWWRAHGLGRDALAGHAELVEATRFGCLVAAKTCERPGASPPRLAELGGFET